MANYRIDGETLQKNYQRQQQTLSERKEQPTTVPMGNYRIDQYGNPIFPEKNDIPASQVQTDDQDYFNQAEANEAPVNQIQENIYHLNDYRPSESYPDAAYQNYPGQREPRVFKEVVYQGNHRLDNRSNWQKINQKLSTVINPAGNNASIQKLPKGLIKLSSIFIIIYLLMILSGWQLLPFNKVNQIVVTGNNYVDSQAIEYSSRIRATDTVDDVIKQRQTIEAKIVEENPIVESIVLTRKNWMQLQLKVTEHQVVAKVEMNGQYVPILTNGEKLDDQITIATVTDQALAQLPTVNGFTQKGKLIELTTILRQVNPTVLANIETIDLSNDPQKPNGIQVQMKDGNKVRAIISTFAQKVNFYPEMVQQIGGQIGTINLEVGAYFTPESGSTNSVNLGTN